MRGRGAPSGKIGGCGGAHMWTPCKLLILLERAGGSVDVTMMGGGLGATVARGPPRGVALPTWVLGALWWPSTSELAVARNDGKSATPPGRGGARAARYALDSARAASPPGALRGGGLPPLLGALRARRSVGPDRGRCPRTPEGIFGTLKSGQRRSAGGWQERHPSRGGLRPCPARGRCAPRSILRAGPTGRTSTPRDPSPIPSATPSPRRR